MPFLGFRFLLAVVCLEAPMEDRPGAGSNSGLPDSGVNEANNVPNLGTLTIDPVITSTIYVGTSKGVFVGQTCSRLALTDRIRSPDSLPVENFLAPLR
jgi:hypothetical protein